MFESDTLSADTSSMIMSLRTCFMIIVFLSTTVLANEGAIENLTRTDKTVQNLRSEISSSIFIVKGKRDAAKLPDLKFYAYTVKEGDNLWNIIARTSLDMDTILTVNSLKSTQDIKPGDILYFPNMRGIVLKVKQNDTLDSIAGRHNIQPIYIEKANKMEGLSKTHIFVPCGTLSKEERFAYLSTGFVSPVSPVRITSGFGMRNDPFLNVPKFHAGIDIICATGTPVKASQSGIVKYAGYMKNYGNLVIIKHTNGYETYYGHLNGFAVKKDQRVTKGALIAYSGNTGRSTGPHLHFEIRKNDKAINPLKILKLK
jgi:murein DD-endopeptidase MepM/ murein hydrolase activator NlpD